MPPAAGVGHVRPLEGDAVGQALFLAAANTAFYDSLRCIHADHRADLTESVIEGLNALLPPATISSSPPAASAPPMTTSPPMRWPRLSVWASATTPRPMPCWRRAIRRAISTICASAWPAFPLRRRSANTARWAPGFHIGNVYVMAGVPMVMRAMLEAIAPELPQGITVTAVTVSAQISRRRHRRRPGRHPEGQSRRLDRLLSFLRFPQRYFCCTLQSVTGRGSS